jgi:hypothetical protein
MHPYLFPSIVIRFCHIRHENFACDPHSNWVLDIIKKNTHDLFISPIRNEERTWESFPLYHQVQAKSAVQNDIDLTRAFRQCTSNLKHIVLAFLLDQNSL